MAHDQLQQLLPNDVLGEIATHVVAAVDLQHLRTTSRAVSELCTRPLFRYLRVPADTHKSDIRHFLTLYGHLALRARFTELTLLDIAKILPMMPGVQAVVAQSCTLWLATGASLSWITPRSHTIASWTFSACIVSWPSLVSVWTRLGPTDSGSVRSLKLGAFTSSLEDPGDLRRERLGQSSWHGFLAGVHTLELSIEGRNSVVDNNWILSTAVDVVKLIIVVLQRWTEAPPQWPLVNMSACQKLAYMHITLNMGDLQLFGQSLLYCTPRRTLSNITLLIRFQRVSDAAAWLDIWRRPHIFSSALKANRTITLTFGIIIAAVDGGSESSAYIQNILNQDWKRTMYRCHKAAMPEREWRVVEDVAHLMLQGRKYFPRSINV